MDQIQGHNQQKMRAAPAAPRRYDGQAGNPLYDPANGGHYGESEVLQSAWHNNAPWSHQSTQANHSSQVHLLLYVLNLRTCASRPVYHRLMFVLDRRPRPRA